MNDIIRMREKVNRNLKIKTHDGNYSNNQKCRSSLWLDWESEPPIKTAIAIGINPSKANDVRSDNTLTRLGKFLDSYGFGGMIMLNLFESYSTDQKGIIRPTATDFNNFKDDFEKADAIIIVWGVENKYLDEKNAALEVLKDYADKLYCLYKEDSYPMHPSRMNYKTYSLKKFPIKEYTDILEKAKEREETQTTAHTNKQPQ